MVRDGRGFARIAGRAPRTVEHPTSGRGQVADGGPAPVPLPLDEGRW
jgi:hypothetical protein